MIILAELKTDEGQTVAVLMVKPKEFKTGSRGFYGNGKIDIGSRRYQTQVQLVEIGSKLAKPEKVPAERPRAGRRTTKRVSGQ